MKVGMIIIKFDLKGKEGISPRDLSELKTFITYPTEQFVDDLAAEIEEALREFGYDTIVGNLKITVSSGGFRK